MSGKPSGPTCLPVHSQAGLASALFHGCRDVGRRLLQVGQRALGRSAGFLCCTLMSSSTCCQCLSLVKCFWTRASFRCNSFLSSETSSLITCSGFWTDNCNLFVGKNILSVLQYLEISGYTDRHQFEFLPDLYH